MAKRILITSEVDELEDGPIVNWTELRNLISQNLN